MINKNFDIQKLLQEKANIEASLRLIPYDGTPEIKENSSGKYLYIRKRIMGKLTSTYVDKYSEELYSTLLRYSKQSKELKKQLRKIEKELSSLGYSATELPSNIKLNLDFARANMKSNIYEQAVLEGVATTYPQTETIIENGIVAGMTPTDIQKILNLKHAWEFIMDEDIIQIKSDFSILSYIAGLVNEGFYYNGGQIRSVPVSIGGCSYIPPLPIESSVKENINSIISSNNEFIDIAIALCLYCMKTQIFNDGNKRASVIFANHYLISKGQGLLVIPEKEVPTFKKMLVDYYEDKDEIKIKAFMKDKCWRKL